MNNGSLKGEENEKVFTGSRIQRYSFADFIILFRGFHFNIYFYFSTFKTTVETMPEDGSDSDSSLTDLDLEQIKVKLRG